MTVKKTSFNQTIANLRHGLALDEIDDVLCKALQATQDTGKQSTVTVKLTIKPNGSGVYKITDDIKSTIPQFEKEATVLFTDGDQQLVREDPRQQKLNLQQMAASGPIDIKSVPAQSNKTLKTFN